MNILIDFLLAAFILGSMAKLFGAILIAAWRKPRA